MDRVESMEGIYRKILSAVDEHLSSEVAARYALNLSMACGAKFYICFIHEKGMPKLSFNRAEEAMKRLFFMAEEAGIPVESITESGDPVKEIGRIVRHERVDIVFASMRHKDMEKGSHSGAFTQYLLRRLSCSIALAKVVHMGRVHPKKILIPLKGKMDHIGERAYFTAKMAEGFGSKIYMFHVPRALKKFFHGEVHLTPSQWEKRLPEDMFRFRDLLKKYKVEFEERLFPGEAGRSISIETSLKRHDLVIMGASERGFVSSVMKKSPVKDVLKETPCDLILLKPRHED